MDGNGCFVCGNDCSNSTLVLINLETKKYKTRYTILIGNLINSEYELRISKSDKICEKCSVLIEKYDELQYETKTVKSVLSRQIANTYSIETDEELVYMDKSKIFCELRSNGIDDSKKYSCKVCPNFVTTCIDTVNSHIIYHKIIEEEKHTLNNTIKEAKMATTSKSRVQQTAREVPKIPEKVKSSSSVVNVTINNIQETQQAPKQQQHQQLSAQYSINSGSQEIDQDTLDSLIDMSLLDDEFYDSNLKDHKCAVEYCTETFAYACDYVRHLKLKHKSNLNHIFSALKSNLKRPKKISKFMCPYCFTKTSSNEQLEMHVKQHEEIAGKPAQLSERIGDFVASLMQACRCTICDCEILDPTELECNHEIVKNGMAPKLNCIFCDCYFYNEKLYNNHLALVHTQCFVCGSAFNDNNVLNDHICSHLSHSEFACLFCKDIYQTNKNRLDHMKSKHSANCCSYCDDWYKNTSELEHHLRYSHADKRYKEQKSSICDYCGATFKNKQLYEVHLQTDHKTRKIYKCSTCKQDFRFRYLLMDHVSCAHNRTIIDNEVNFYKCCFCMKGFPSQNRKLFIEHLEKHQSNSTFCFDCNTNIESVQSLESHRERFHQDFSKTVDKSVVAENSKRHANVKQNNNGSKMTFVPATINHNKLAGKNELSTQQSTRTKQRPINEVIPQQHNVQIAATSPKQPQYEVINNLNIQEEAQQQTQSQQIMIQNEDGSFLNNLILTENGELIIQNLDGLLPNGQESDEGTQIQISNLEQFLMEQGLSSNTEISYIQPDIISDGQVVIQSDDGTTQESLMQTYKEIFEPDDEITAELIDSSDAQQMEHQTQNILLNGEYVLQTPSSTLQQLTQQQTKANNNNNVLQATIEHVDVGNAQVLDAANQSTLDELGDILLEVAAAAEKEKKPKAGDPNQKVMRETLWGKKRPAEPFREANAKRRSTKQLEILPETETPARNFSQAYEFFVKGFDAKKQKQL
ncbi:hypothetical protein ACKWTF_002764 [Chironomus riparius]